MNVRTIAVVLTGDATSLRTQLAMAGREVDTFEKKVDSSSSGMSRWGKMASTGMKIGALALAAGLAVVTTAAIGFETRMRNVNSISHLSEEAFKAQGRSVLELSKTFPQSANVLAEGLYEIASSGFQGAKGLDVLTASAKAASAGMTDTFTSAKAITAVLNAYGLEAEEATAVGNVLFQGVNVGVMSFEELATSIGNVVGTAAAAKVDITDLTAGLATMTLSGISAAEASTSMNRVLTALVDPSDSLAAAFNALGYESGAQALEVDGLYGVMEKLRIVTGGNLEILLRYFPEIRGARGALALMSAEGENYRKTQEAMNKAQERGGAMQQTFNEQMKSTSAQLNLVKNNLSVAAIELGNNFLPYVKDGIKEIRTFTGWLMDMGQEAGERAAPALGAIRPIFEDLKELLGDLIDVGEPVVGLLAAMGGMAIISALNLLLTTLEKTTSFLVDHKEIVTFIAVLYGIHLVTSLASAVGGFTGLTAAAVAAGNATVAAGARGVIAIAGMNAAFLALSVTTAAVAAGFVLIQQENARLEKLGHSAVSDWMDGFNVADADYFDLIGKLKGIEDAFEHVHNQSIALLNDRSAADKITGALGHDERKHLKAAEEDLKRLKDQYGGYIRVVQGTANELNISFDEAHKALQEQGVQVEEVADGTVRAEEKQQDAIRATVKAREEHMKTREAEATMAGATQDELSRLANLTGEEFEAEASRITEAANAAREFSQSVGDSWRKQQDVVAALGAQQDVTGKGILDWYKVMIKDGENFSENIRKAVELGYDPGLIARTLEAGPAQAGPLLEAMIDNQGAHFIESVNQSEKALEELNATAVEMARLTNRAMNAETDQMTRDLNTAMKLATLIMASGGQSTMQALVDQLGIGAEEVKRIADSYGITLGAALDPIRSATGLPPIPRNRATVGGGNRVSANAEGGYLDPREWGDTNADTIPAWLMPGEVVIKKKSVEKIGVENLLYANERGELPIRQGAAHFAGGGLAGAMSGGSSAQLRGGTSAMNAYAAGGVNLPGPPGFPAGDFGATSQAASAQTYLKAVAWAAAQQAALGGGGFSRSGGGGPAGQYTPGMLRSRADILGRFGGMDVYGYANRNIAGTNTRSAHGMWRAFDFMVGLGNVGKGNAVANHLIQNAGSYGLKGLIWNAMSNYGGGWKPYRHPSGASDPNSMHLNHVHAEYFRQGGRVRRGMYDGGGWLMPGLTMAENWTGKPERIVGPNETPPGMVMPRVSVSVNVYIGDQPLRGMIREEIKVEHDKRDRRDRSFASA